MTFSKIEWDAANYQLVAFRDKHIHLIKLLYVDHHPDVQNLDDILPIRMRHFRIILRLSL